MSCGVFSLSPEQKARPVALITGFPRLLARALTIEGIQRWNAAKIFVLYEEQHQEDADRFLKHLPSGVKDNVIPLVGQLSGIYLILSGCELTEILKNVILVFLAAY